MKTPEEIKKGLECCQDTRCEGCPYSNMRWCAKENGADALAYIKQLEARCERLLRTLEMLNDALKEYHRRNEDETPSRG